MVCPMSRAVVLLSGVVGGGLLVGWVGSSGGGCGVDASATRCRV